MKNSTLWGVAALLSLLAAGPAAAQCPAVTNVNASNLTSTTADIGAYYSAAQAESYTYTYQPAAGGTPVSFTVAASAVGTQHLGGLQPSTDYRVQIVTNCAGGQTSAPASTTFTTYPPAPANDECAAATALPVTADCSAPLSGTLTSATPTTPTLAGSTACQGLNPSPADVWYRFVATGTTHILRVTTGFNANVEVRAGTCPGPATVLLCATVSGGSRAPGGTLARQLDNLVSGQPYFVRLFLLDGNAPAPGSGSMFTICLTPGPPVPANDECAAATYVFVPGPACRSLTAGTVVGATASVVPAAPLVAPTGPRDVWYRFVATNSTQTLELEAVRHTDQFALELSGGGCDSPVVHAIGSTTPEDGFRFYAPAVVEAVSCVPGNTYWVRIYALSSLPLVSPSGEFTLCVRGLLPCQPPSQLTATAGSTTAQLSWQAGYNTPASAYTVEYGPAGFTLGTGTRTFTTATSLAATGLFPSTAYSYYVRSDCGGSQGSTAFVGPTSFQTQAPPAGCDPPTNLAAFNPTYTGAQLTWSYPASSGGTPVSDLEYGPQGFTPGTGTRLTGVYSGQPVNGLLPSTDYCFYVRRDCGNFVGPACFRTQGPATLPDLTVSTAQTLAGGSYRNVTITGTGTLSLTGDLSVSGLLQVQPGGTLLTTYLASVSGQRLATCATLIGPGSFELQDGATLGVCAGQGLSSTGSSGTVQLRGGRSFSAGATYAYQGRLGLQYQATGPGLPAQVRNLRVGRDSVYCGLLLTQPLAVREVLALPNGALDTNGKALVLLSDADGTALVDNAGGVITGNVTVQRYISSTYRGAGYRHYSPPISNATVGSLATSSFTPVVNGAYNTAASPGQTRPYPTVYGYDEARLATSPALGGTPFDKGWLSPAALSSPLAVGRGYAVHLPASVLVSFTGPLNQGSAAVAVTRGPSADAGWVLVGNPYPSPLDCATLTVGPGSSDNLNGVGAAIYVFEGTGPYAGQYRTTVAGVGSAPVIASGQGFFVRALPSQSYPNVYFSRANRVTTFQAADNTFHRTAAETRSLLTLTLGTATSTLADPATVYFAAAATTGFDPAGDAAKLPNTTGLNLASQLGSQDYAINGLPLPGTQPVVVPLAVSVPTAGSYELAVSQLLNFGAGTALYLHDAQAGTLTLLTAATRYAFTLSGTAAPGRFSLEFRPAGALATSTPADPAQLHLFPNPAHGTAVLALAPAAQPRVVQVLDAVGRPVYQGPLPARATTLTLELGPLPAGLYVVRCGAASARLTVE